MQWFLTWVWTNLIALGLNELKGVLEGCFHFLHEVSDDEGRRARDTSEAEAD